MSQKVGNTLSNVVRFLSTYAVSMYICWQLALLVLVVPLILLIPGIIYRRATDDMSAKMMAAYEAANSIVEESLSSIRTVQSCTAETRIVSQFSKAQAGTMKLGFKLPLAKGASLAPTGLVYLLWGAVGCLGQVLVAQGKSTGVQLQVIVVGFISSISVVSMAHALPNFKSLAEGTLAAQRIFEIIDRVPINSDNMSSGCQVCKRPSLHLTMPPRL